MTNNFRYRKKIYSKCKDLLKSICFIFHYLQIIGVRNNIQTLITKIFQTGGKHRDSFCDSECMIMVFCSFFAEALNMSCKRKDYMR